MGVFPSENAVFPFQEEELGICLGHTNNDGNEMCQWFLHQNGRVVLRKTLIRLRLDSPTVTNET